MASIEDRRSIGQEVVFRIRRTGSGVKVIEYDGTGLADGYMAKSNRRYFYGDDAEEKATEYAYRTQEKLEDVRDCPVIVVELGEVMAKKLATEGVDA
ncbi:hypothetical protein [Natrarchaeobius oligotrophus]|uniref:Uncharacterized protein n=1 Tax=Natrarchaeobius chitinivorans TaxID=1679083 RepID=A0A3N6MBE8_NATCH|nr:hypothetical protein [Natrarchaeobius chitinivorans]RQG93760.1 hypothetical protein EA472_22800 [Natrarchaeobius chitinivorans]